MPKTILFHCNASNLIGVGHVTRCLAIAEVAIERGWDVQFLGALRDCDWLVATLSAKGIRLVTEVDRYTYDAIVIDSYSVSADDLIKLKALSSVTLSIIDREDCDHQSSLTLLHGITPHQVPNDTCLTGAKHLLIGSRFREAKKLQAIESQQGPELPLRILISIGGSDAANVRRQVLEDALRAETRSRISVVGPQFRFEPQNGGKSHEVAFHDWSPDVAMLAAQADLIVTAAGVSAFEFLFLERAVAIYQVAQNQQLNYTSLSNSGLAIGLGQLGTNSLIQNERLATTIDTAQIRHAARSASIGVIDGLGAFRVMDRLMQV